MFTGIVEEMGKVLSLTKSKEIVLWDGSVGEGWILAIQASLVLQGAYEGCSIAVNGTCLTVTQFDKHSFTVGCAPETMRRTNLIDLKTDDPVNLERSIAADGRNSGHFVQGHVDTTGIIEATWNEGDSLWIRIGIDESIYKYIVPKGFIAIDGTSLTVCDVVKRGNSSSSSSSSSSGTNSSSSSSTVSPSSSLSSSTVPTNTATNLSIPSPSSSSENISSSYGYFTVMLIEYTQKHIIMPQKTIGQRVNIEVDVMGKYIERSTHGLVYMIETMNTQFTNVMDKLTQRIDSIENRLKAAGI